jgi:orotate phosphoribosyltransferase
MKTTQDIPQSTMTAREKLIQLLAERSFSRGHFMLASGRSSDFYIDARMTTMSPEGLQILGPLAIEVMRQAGWSIDSVGGLTLGADPLAYSISTSSNDFPPLIRAFTVRKEAKTHGQGKLIEGPFRKGDSVVVVEDVITTGSSAIHAINAVLAAGGSVSGVLAVVDRQEGGVETIQNVGYDVIPLTTIQDLILYADDHRASADVQSNRDTSPPA